MPRSHLHAALGPADFAAAAIGALRPAIIMGTVVTKHPLGPWMVREMGLALRKQILIGACRHLGL